MDIYFNDEINEVSLIFKGFVIGDFSDEGYIKVKYSLGELFINFVELDHDKIIKTIESDFSLVNKDYETYESSIDNLFSNLTELHPYFYDVYQTFENMRDMWEVTLSLYYELKETIQDNEFWFNDEKSIQNIKKILKEHYKLLPENKSGNSFKAKVEGILNECVETLNKDSNLIKEKLLEFCHVGKKYKIAVEYCLDSENPNEYSDLTSVERYFLFEQTHGKYNLRNYIFPSFKIGTKENPDIYREDSSITDTTNYNELKKKLPNEPLVMFEYYQSDIKGLCYLEFMKLIKKGIFVRKCNNCQKYFINTGRADTLYCDRIVNADRKTCRDVGAMNQYREKVSNDPIMEIYQKYYKKNYARIKYKSESKRMSKQDFEKWSNQAMEMREKAKSGKITFDEFKEWLEIS
jgi:hypothetical protein